MIVPAGTAALQARPAGPIRSRSPGSVYSSGVLAARCRLDPSYRVAAGDLHAGTVPDPLSLTQTNSLEEATR